MAYRLEAPDVLPEIQSLAERVLTKEELSETDKVAKALLGKRDERTWGIAK